MYALQGKTITSFKISPDRREIVFQSTNGPVRMVTRDECCSETWIESLDNPDALRGNVRSVTDIEMPNLGNIPTPHRDSVDYVEYYGLRIETDYGVCVLDYRNDSNGCYGGSIVDGVAVVGQAHRSRRT